MNLKHSTIALAVAAVMTIPAVHAGANEIYASARIGVENTDTGGVSDLDVRSFDSLFGMRGETDLGNGMSGYGRYEFEVDFDDPGDSSGGNIDLRHRYVGLRGEFGNIYLGKASHTFYRYVIEPIDNPWWGSGFNMIRYGIRTDNAITYEVGTGQVNFGISGYFLSDDEENAPDSIEAGVKFEFGDVILAAAIDSSETPHGSAKNDDDIFGLALSGLTFGDTALAFNYQAQDEDQSFALDFGFGNAYFHVEQLYSDESGTDPLFVNLGYTQTLGRKTLIYYELTNDDADTGDSDDDTTVLRAVLVYDII